MSLCDRQVAALVDTAAGMPVDSEARAHIDACPSCQAELKALRGTEGLLRSTAAHPDDFSLSGFAYRTADRAEMFRDHSARGFWWGLTRPMRLMAGFCATTLTFASVLFVASRTPRPVKATVEPPPLVAGVVRPAPDDSSADEGEEDEVAALTDEREDPVVSLDSALDGLSSDELDELMQQLAAGATG